MSQCGGGGARWGQCVNRAIIFEHAPSGPFKEHSAGRGTLSDVLASDSHRVL